MSELLPIKKIFNFEKGSLQSTKCTPGAFTFVTAGTDWKTHNEFTHETEALILAVAASGSLGRCHYIKDKFIASDLCFILTPKDKKTYPIDLEFYHQIFRSIKNDLVQKTATGTSKLSINRTNFGNYKIPYFDIEHQKTFKKILLNVNEKKDRLLVCSDNQENLVNILRNQILQDAISGKLTFDWRTKNPDIEPVSKLLEKIKAEKEKLITEKKIKKEKPLPKIAEDEAPFDLPEKWEWCRLGEIIVMNYGSGLTKHERKTDGKYPVFGSNGIVGYHDEFLTEHKSIIIGRKGSAGAINISEIPSWTTDVAYFVEETKHLDFNYQYYLLLSLGLDSLGKGIKPGLNRNEAYNIIFPLPPLAEQKAIVYKVEKLMEHVSILEEKIKQNKQDAEMLMQSFLVEAFKN